jgi:hypothetical protein
MKPFSISARTALWGITALCAGLGLHLAALAQSAPADTAQVTTTGQITSTTCALSYSNFGDNAFSYAAPNYALGNFTRSNLSGGVGVAFGTAVGGLFGLDNPAKDATGCAAASTRPGWDLSIQLGAEQITSIPSSTLGTTTFIKNALSTANGGTDAVVLLRGGSSLNSPANTTISAASQALTLVPNAGNTANFVGGGSTPANNLGFKVLSAQFVSTTASAPSAGRFSQTLTLLAVYR